jgi:hypothetical protein
LAEWVGRHFFCSLCGKVVAGAEENNIENNILNKVESKIENI